MCNACGFQCCGSDMFGGCGCDHCNNPECWDDDELEDYEDVASELHSQDVARMTTEEHNQLRQILADHLMIAKAAAPADGN